MSRKYSDATRAWEKTYGAVLVLSTSNLPLRDRIDDAYHHELELLKLPGLPWPDLQQRYDDLCYEICPHQGCRAIDVLRQWDDYQVDRIAKEIVGLYDAIARRQSG